MAEHCSPGSCMCDCPCLLALDSWRWSTRYGGVLSSGWCPDWDPRQRPGACGVGGWPRTRDGARMLGCGRPWGLCFCQAPGRERTVAAGQGHHRGDAQKGSVIVGISVGPDRYLGGMCRYSTFGISVRAIGRSGVPYPSWGDPSWALPT